MPTADSPVKNAEDIRLAQAIDHTKLTFSPGEDENEAIRKLCQEAREFGFYAVCVRPQHVAKAKQELTGTAVKVATVIGFPAAKVALPDERANPTIGNMATRLKVEETKKAIAAGADELDLVMNVARLKAEATQNHSDSELLNELCVILEAAQGRPIKVIIETDLLSRDEIIRATTMCAKAGMSMVKTSTGMVDGGQGATIENVRLIADTLKKSDPPLGIKASGGIKNRQQALKFLDAGVSRLGTSSGIAILNNSEQSLTSY